MKIDRWNRALVTGASSGIGLAFAKLLAKEGTDLVLVARSEDKLNDLANELDVQTEVLVADLTLSSDVDLVIDRINDEKLPIDLVINNAGFGIFGPVAQIDADAEAEMLELNIMALQKITNSSVTLFTERGYGSLLNVASIAAFAPFPTGAAYAASKAFVLSYTSAIAEEIENKDIKISCLNPGLTKTNFAERSEYDTNNIPEFMWESALTVAEAGLVGLAKGDDVVTPGVQNKALKTITKVTPEIVIKKSRKLLFSQEAD